MEVVARMVDRVAAVRVRMVRVGVVGEAGKAVEAMAEVGLAVAVARAAAMQDDKIRHLSLQWNRS